MNAIDALNKVAKWRTVFVGWLLGTRSMDDPEAAAHRDLFNTMICLRAENNAIVQLLVKKRVFNLEEWDGQLATEAYLLDQMYEQKFPGWKSTDIGMHCYDTALASKTMAGWRP
jgi:hypothetical protein